MILGGMVVHICSQCAPSSCSPAKSTSSTRPSRSFSRALYSLSLVPRSLVSLRPQKHSLLAVPYRDWVQLECFQDLQSSCSTQFHCNSVQSSKAFSVLPSLWDLLLVRSSEEPLRTKRL